MTKIVLEFDSREEYEAFMDAYVEENMDEGCTPEEGKLEEFCDDVYGDAEHWSETKKKFVQMNEMNPRYLLNAIAKEMEDVKRDEEIAYDVRALIFHLWKKLAEEDRGRYG